MPKTERMVAGCCLFALTAPSVVTGLSRFIGIGPAAAQAQGAFQPMPDLPPASLWTAEVPNAGPAPEPAASPFWHLADYVAPEPERPARSPDPVRPSDPEFTLTAVMPHPARPAAIINARPYGVGDAVAPGWRLVSIDGRAREVVLRNAAGREITVRMASRAP